MIYIYCVPLSHCHTDDPPDWTVGISNSVISHCHWTTHCAVCPTMSHYVTLYTLSATWVSRFLQGTQSFSSFEWFQSPTHNAVSESCPAVSLAECLHRRQEPCQERTIANPICCTHHGVEYGFMVDVVRVYFGEGHTSHTASQLPYPIGWNLLEVSRYPGINQRRYIHGVYTILKGYTYIQLET